MNTPTLNMMNGQGFLISIIFINSKLLDSGKKSQYNKYLKKYPNQSTQSQRKSCYNEPKCLYICP